MFGMNFMDGLGGHFKTRYRCYSVSMLPMGSEMSRQDAEMGGKIFLPPSALEQLTRQHINYPMLFKLTNSQTGRTTHCGVLEFVADEGKVYLPYWMMQNLTLDEGGLLQVESASLPVANYAKFQPHSVDFLDLTNPKAVLESRLRRFACLSTDDVIAIIYNGKTYELSVLETKPASAVTVIECDLNVDFAPPIGYQETFGEGSKAGNQKAGEKDDGEDDEEHLDVSKLMPKPNSFQAFTGAGCRLDGKVKRTTSESNSAEPAAQEVEYVRGIPDYDFQLGHLKFIRGKPKVAQNGSADNNDQSNSEPFEAFKGKGQSLRR